ncbi:MAG: fibronectin type III domain-containing protein, partial [Clostridia bacterium]|nr:fibronectin type III domain-containing protein [Clostridia bacterium]
MKSALTWSYRPYRPPFFDGDATIPVCRMAPGEDDVTLEWLGESASYTVFWRKRGENNWEKAETTQTEYTVRDLTPGVTYEFKVEDGKGHSRIRLAKPAKVVGTVVN